MEEQKRIVENNWKLMILGLPLCPNCFSRAFPTVSNLNYTIVECPNCNGLLIIGSRVYIFKFNKCKFGIRLLNNENIVLCTLIQQVIALEREFKGVEILYL